MFIKNAPAITIGDKYAFNNDNVNICCYVRRTHIQGNNETVFVEH